jgi:hypothetical protein
LSSARNEKGRLSSAISRRILSVETTNPAFTERNKPMQFSEVSIVTPTALYVQMLEAENAPVKKQVRIKRSDIDRDEISAEMRALGRHIAHCRKKGRSVRIPAMRVSEWGQVLRTLELKRAFN